MNLAADSDDFVRIPILLLDKFFTRLIPQRAAPLLLVELAPPAGSDVRLITTHLAVGQRFAAELNAAVFLVRRQFDFACEAKIAEKHLAFQEFIFLQAGWGAT